jgi:hypothetical protein
MTFLESLNAICGTNNSQLNKVQKGKDFGTYLQKLGNYFTFTILIT